MPRHSRIQIAKHDIVGLFEERGQKVYREGEIAEILEQNRGYWRLTMSQSLAGFIDFLVSRTNMRKVTLRSARSQVMRYTWGEATAYEIAVSLHENAYLSHGTAVVLHGLTDQIQRKIYVNHEQSPKHTRQGMVSQESINAAFRRPVRISNSVFGLLDYEIVSINGKYTDRLEVGTVKVPGGSEVPVTRIERTLIDITVRPIYAGGVIQVLECFREAKSRMSTNVLVATLKGLNYAYPYHQCIGFYLERAGYEGARVDQLRALPRVVDFYLTNEMIEVDYDANWRLFYPRGM